MDLKQSSSQFESSDSESSKRREKERRYQERKHKREKDREEKLKEETVDIDIAETETFTLLELYLPPHLGRRGTSPENSPAKKTKLRSKRPMRSTRSSAKKKSAATCTRTTLRRR